MEDRHAEPLTPSAATRRWKVTLYEGGFIVDAPNENVARIEAFQAVAESLDLFVVEEIAAALSEEAASNG